MSSKKHYPDPFIPADRKSYYFWFFDERKNKRKLVSTGYGRGKKEAARAYIRTFIDDLHTTLCEQTFTEYSDKFYIWETCPRVKRILGEGKIIGKKYVSDSKKLLIKWVQTDPVFPHLVMHKIKRSHLLDLRDRLRERTTLHSVNNTMTAVKAIFSEAYFREDINRDPGHRIGALKTEKSERGIFSPADIKNLFGEYAPWKNRMAYVVFYLAAFTGMRSGEIRALKWDCVNFEDRILEIKRAWKTNDELGPPKWNKKRSIKMSASLVGQLLDWREFTLHHKNDDFVFSQIDKTPLGKTWWKKNFNEPIEKIIPDRLEKKLSPHSFRHSLNTNLLIAGCDPILVQKFLGWSNSYIPMLVPVQAGYTHIQVAPLEKVAEMIDEIYT